MPVNGVEAHIDDVSRRLEAWLRGILADVEGAESIDLAFVSHFRDAVADMSSDTAASMSAAEAGAGGVQARIEICFQSITAEKPDRALLHRDAAFLLTYVLRVVGPDALASQRIYSTLYFAAHEDADFKVGQPADRSENAAPRGLEERPALLTLTARLVRSERAAAPKVVMHPLEVRLRPLGHISGKVVTRAGVPVARAEIDARALDKRAVADSGGRFTISGAPATGAVSLTVRARNRSIDVSVDTEAQAEIVIVMPEETEHG